MEKTTDTWSRSRSAVAILAVTVLAGGGCGEGATGPDSDIVSTDGLAAHYSFASDATDQSASNNDARAIGTFDAGALVFGDNVTDHLSVPSLALDGAQDFSIAVWVRIDMLRADDHHVLMNLSAPGERYAFAITYRAFSESWFAQWGGGSTAFDRESTVVDGSWHHLTIARTGDVALAYLDGEEISAEVVVGSPLEVEAGGLVFGQGPHAFSPGFDPDLSWSGAIDELRIYRRALSAAEAGILASSGR